MKAQILKIAGVKSEKEFYKKYPSEEVFMKQHGKAFKKAQMGAKINLAQPAFKPLSYATQFDEADKMITGSTGAERQAALDKQKAAAPQNGEGGGGGFDIGGLMKMFGSAGGEGGAGMGDIASSLGGARYGADIPRAQYGSNLQPAGLAQFPNQGISAQMPTAQQVQGGIAPQANGWTKTAEALGGIAGPVGDLIGGIGALQQEKEALKGAEQARDVSKLSLQATTSTDVDARRQMQDTFSKQRNAMMQPNVNLNAEGVGTVIGRNGIRLQGGGEIQNTYAPDTLYDDLGYEPLNDSNTKQYYYGGNIPQAQNGFANWQNSMSGGGSGFSGAGQASAGGTPWGAISSKATGIGQSLMGGQNAGGKIGGTAGKAIGSIFGPAGGAIGEFAGGMIGNAVDTTAKKIKKANAATERNMQGMASANMAKGIQSQNQSYMEDGGYLSHDWNPQVIAMFGDHTSEDFADYARKDEFRAGGHLKSYTPPSERAMEIYEDGGDIKSYGLGGELETHWGGGAETISQNPYLPGTGETVMFRGKSHEEYSPNGETGIGVTYGGNPVEVERGEPMVELEEGGVVDPMTGEVQKSGVVFGNLKIPNQYIDMLGDKNAKGKKFKNYVADLSKIEERQNKLIEKSTNELDGFTPITSFDKLKMTALQANIQGANMKLKDIADKKINAASLQNAINDTAEERGLVADDLARGKVKIDKEAQKQYAKFGGKFTKAQVGINTSKLTDEELMQQADRQGGELDEVVIKQKKKNKREQIVPLEYMKPKGLTYSTVPKSPASEVRSEYLRSLDSTKEKEKEKDDAKFPWETYANQLINYLRPSDQEALDMEQLYPEMYAMSSNQLEPVPAQGYQPELGVPYDISLQDQLNANQADYRAAQRNMGYNPAAQANLNAQKYQANQGILGNQFRANQEMRDKAYSENRNILNQAKLTNLGIFDKQYERQAQALSNTKATTQAALNSIADKYAKNKLENRTLGVMENMYNYRFDENGRVVNMNPLAQLNWKGRGNVGSPKDVAPEGYEYETILKKKKKEDTAKNGSVVRSYKNI